MKNIFRLLIIAVTLTIGLNSCCKLITIITLEVKFKDFDFSTMDSVMLIKTDRDSINKHIDTMFCDLTTNHVIKISLSVYEKNGNFIIKNFSSAFEHHITEINVEKTKGNSCGGRIKTDFKYNGILYKNKQKITIKP
ncbi:MAG: hypothetical protein KF900_09215 [Bacteroidetes bacterium]|nr:hypothetical protein [Bacteroidota bacterium]